MIRQLLATHVQLGAWEESLRADLAGGTPHRAHTERLILLLVEARAGIVRRLAELDCTDLEKLDSRAPFAVRTPAGSGASARTIDQASKRSLKMCIKACRASGRALVRAFREAQRATDMGTANMLYGPLRAVEKQLWMIDPLQTR